jgi:hypothetical protein
MSRSLIVAVCGGKGAGKSTFAAALTQSLTRYFYEIFLVSGDRFMPSFDLWGVQNNVSGDFPVKSIGKILSYPDISDEYIKKHVIAYPGKKEKSHIGLMGYLVDDDCELYGGISGNAAGSLLYAAKRLYQVTIVDCTLPQTDKLTERALLQADVTITLLEPNALGCGGYYSQQSFIRRNMSDGRARITVASKVGDDNAIGEFEDITGVRFDRLYLPYTKQARDKLNSLDLFSEYGGAYGDAVAGLSRRIKEESEK